MRRLVDLSAVVMTTAVTPSSPLPRPKKQLTARVDELTLRGARLPDTRISRRNRFSSPQRRAEARTAQQLPARRSRSEKLDYRLYKRKLVFKLRNNSAFTVCSAWLEHFTHAIVLFLSSRGIGFREFRKQQHENAHLRKVFSS